jgi:hypothetical protein
METLKSVDVREGGDKGDNAVDNGREVDECRVWRRSAGGGQFIVRSRVAAAGVVVVAVLLAASGCSSSGGSGPRVQAGLGSASPSESGAPSSAPKSPAEREAADRAAVEQVWSDFWVLEQTLDVRYPPAEWPARVAKVAVDPIKALVLTARAKDHRNGVVGFGAVVTRPFWLQPVAGKNTAVMQDCLDGSRAGSMVAKTGRKLTVGQARTNMRAFFVRGGDGKWRVQRIESHVNEKC